MNAQQNEIIRVVFTEHHHAGVPDGQVIPSDRLAEFTFNPLVSRSVGEMTLRLRDLPALLISLGYAAHTGGITLYIAQSGHEVVHPGNFAPTTNSYLGIRLSDCTSISIHFNRNPE
jgi:hypothetical protein